MSSFVYILGYLSLIYLIVCTILAGVTLAVSRSFLRGYSFSFLRSMRWFITLPLAWLEEYLEFRKERK